MKNKSLIDIVRCDNYRVYRSVRLSSVIKSIILGESFKYIFWMRMAAYFNHKCTLLYLLSKLMMNRYKYRFGISISERTKIGKGFYVGHFGCIFISPEAVLGDNCNVSQGVTIGKISSGSRKGAPTIGNNVYIGPGAKIIGRLTIGDGVAVGANAVVTRDVPSGFTVAGLPAKIISKSGSVGYINNVYKS